MSGEWIDILLAVNVLVVIVFGNAITRTLRNIQRQLTYICDVIAKGGSALSRSNDWRGE